MSHGRNQSAPIPPRSHPSPTRPPVDLGDAQTAQMFQTLLPSMSPNRVDLPTYFVKTNPTPRSNNFMRNLLKYSEIMTEIRAFESAIMQRRFALLDMERWLLAEETQQATLRGEQALADVEMVRAAGQSCNPDFPGLYMFQPYPQPTGTSFAALTDLASESLHFKRSNAASAQVVAVL